MKRCPYCKALNSSDAVFCWRCYKRLYSVDIDGYRTLRRRIREKVREILQYRDIKELLRDKIRLMAEREEEKEREKEESIQEK
ncbi:MAG: hypothetical protein HXS46_05610 [Theionarchaea archaeon]|nr:MAG: hypothetical protein AYK18_03305 [Theionarchaea archaeon DG-70]MBU7010146.1 hypothetical protein [Theionarchaea archaeon]